MQKMLFPALLWQIRAIRSNSAFEKSKENHKTPEKIENIDNMSKKKGKMEYIKKRLWKIKLM